MGKDLDAHNVAGNEFGQALAMQFQCQIKRSFGNNRSSDELRGMYVLHTRHALVAASARRFRTASLVDNFCNESTTSGGQVTIARARS